MSKFRFTFDLDLGKISPEEITTSPATISIASRIINRMFLSFVRKSALRNLQQVRTTAGFSPEEQAALMAECLRRVKLAIQAEANLTVVALPDDAVIHDDTPERIALAA